MKVRASTLKILFSMCYRPDRQENMRRYVVHSKYSSVVWLPDSRGVIGDPFLSSFLFVYRSFCKHSLSMTGLL